MSNGYGYGYKGAVSPAQTGGYGGYGGYGNYGYGQPSTLPATTFPTYPMAMPTNVSPVSANAPMTLPANAFPNAPKTMPSNVAAQSVPVNIPNGSFVTPSGGNIVSLPGVEESYVENILRLNRGKLASFYMTYENNREWNAKVFRGIIEAAGRDHIIISDPSTGMRYLLLTLNLDYVTFDGPIAYEYPFQGGTVTNVTPLTAREEEQD